jgi:tetratricopeptide (TPR) repeat protein
LADAKLRRQDWSGAQAIAETIKRLDNTSIIADQILGAALSGAHKYDASIAAFQNAVAAAPSATQPMAELVGSLIRAKQTDKAVEFLRSVLKENPNNADAYVILGNIALLNNTPDQAEKNFKVAVAKQPKSDVGYRALAELYLQQKNPDAAVDIIRTGLKDLPDNANLHMALAGMLEQKGDFDAAISEYENLLKQQPGSLIIANNLASLLADHRTDTASLERAQSLAASLRQSPVAQFKDTLGWVDYRQGDFKAAVQLLEEAAAGMPNGALVHYHLGMGYIAVGQLAKASEQLNKALAQSPNSDLEDKIRAGLKTSATQ